MSASTLDAGPRGSQRRTVPAVAVLALAACASCAGNVTSPTAKQEAPPRFAFVPVSGLGSPDSMGVCVAKLMLAGGRIQLMPGSPFAGDAIPMNLVVHPNGRFLYVTSNRAFREPEATLPEITSYAIDPEKGELTQIGPPLPMPDRVRALAITPSGRFLYVATYQTRSTIAAFAVDPVSGHLEAVPGSPFPVREAGILAVDPQGRFLLMTHGSDDESGVEVFRIDFSSGALVPTGQGLVAAGGYPRPGRLLFARDGFVYVSVWGGEAFDGVAGFRLDASSGWLTAMDGLALRAPYQSFGPGRAITPSGEYVLMAGPILGRNIAVYRALPDGKLEAVPGSPFLVWEEAAHFTISDIVVDPSGDYAVLAHIGGALMAMKIDRQTGALTPLRSSLEPLTNEPGPFALSP